MTREEAITNLNMISVAFVEPVTMEQRELIDKTFEVAIKALEQCEVWDGIHGQVVAPKGTFDRIWEDAEKEEQEPCADAVSRKAVLNLTKELRFNSVKGMEDYCYRCIDPDDVEELPPIQQEPNKDLIILSKALITIVNEEGTEYGFTKACEIAERVLGLEKDAHVFYDPREEVI